MKIRIYGVLLSLAVFLAFFGTTPALAAKTRVWGKTINTTASRNSPLSVSARFSGWKQYLNVSFRGVASTKDITYELIYASNGVDQGAGGKVFPNEGNVTKSLFLGTCSTRVCTAHKNISNVRLTITYQTTGGQNVVKKYKVKY
jgi:hypothetical protein